MTLSAIRPYPPLLTLLLSLLIDTGAAAPLADDPNHPVNQQVTDVITLQHRSGSEVEPLVKEFLDPKDVLTSSGNKLLIRTSPARLKEIKRIVNALDTPPRQLMITVQHVEGEHYNNGKQKRYSTDARDSAVPVHRLRVTEGQAAMIEAGLALPQVKQHSRNGYQTSTELEYRETSSGFRVIPRLHGDQVTLDLLPYSSSPGRQGGGQINLHQGQTTVTGKLGEWILIGSSGHRIEAEGRKIYSTRSRDPRSRTIAVKVTEIKE